jgi:hypothetical protein
VPIDVEHTLVWCKLPIQHDDLTDPSIAIRLAQDGIWGFTGSPDPPPSPSTLHLALPALAEWGVTEDKLIRSAPPTDEERVHIDRACSEVQRFVEHRWQGWETCWFVNPPVSPLCFEALPRCILTKRVEAPKRSRTGTYPRICTPITERIRHPIERLHRWLYIPVRPL